MASPQGKARGFITFSEAPYSGGPALEALCRARVTPTAQHFVRSHGGVPEVDKTTFALKVRGLVKRPRSFTLAQLKAMRKRRAEVAIECAGNRRAELNVVEQVTGEIPWGPQAIGNAVWNGVALEAVLEAVGVERTARHVEFVGLDAAAKRGRSTPFAGSVPIDVAIAGGSLLAYGMNGKPLPPHHGAPLRAVIPGYIGARSVKWLGRIEVRAKPSTNHFQAHTYKVVPQGATAKEWQMAPPLGPARVNCAISEPTEGAALRAPLVTVRGYARPSFGHYLLRIELSTDGATTWTRVRAAPNPRGPGAWVTWATRLWLRQGEYVLAARALDGSERPQPSSLERAWNAGGYVNNAWHRVPIHVEG